jgi:hypothetical protein
MIRPTALAVLALATVLPAASNDYANANRQLYVQPREAALGFSGAAFARDGGPNTNPATLAMDSGGEVSAAYAGFFGNTYSTSLFSYVTTLNGLGALGASLDYLLVPDIIDTRDWPVDGAGNPIVPPESQWTYRSSSEVYAHAAWGYRWCPGTRVQLGLGAGVNLLRRRLLEWTGYGIGFDAGGLVHFTRSGVRLALTGEDITTTYINWSHDYDERSLPHLRLGLGWQRDIPYLYGALRITYSSLDLLGNEGANTTTYLSARDSLEAPRQLTFWDDSQFLLYGNLGAEYCIARRVSLRVGLESFRRFTFGAGLALLHESLVVDFAYLTHQLGGSYLVGLTYRWR